MSFKLATCLSRAPTKLYYRQYSLSHHGSSPTILGVRDRADPRTEESTFVSPFSPTSQFQAPGRGTGGAQGTEPIGNGTFGVNNSASSTRDFEAVQQATLTFSLLHRQHWLTLIIINVLAPATSRPRFRAKLAGSSAAALYIVQHL